MSDRVAVSEPAAHRVGIVGDAGVLFEPYRLDLVVYCHRMLDPAFE